MSYNSVLNLKALVGGFYQDLVGAFSVIVKTDCETDGSFTALVSIVVLCQCGLLQENNKIF